jgi:hypothetical protein
VKGTKAGRRLGGKRSGEARRRSAERAALLTWRPELRAATTDHERCLVLARAVQAGIRIGYERAYNRFMRAGKHYATDVLAGAALGFGVGRICE